MKTKLFILFVLYFAVSSICIAAPTKHSKKVAIYTMDLNSDYTTKLGNYLITQFVDDTRFMAIERSQSFLAELSKEQSYQQSGYVSDENITRIGKQFGADYVITLETIKIPNIPDLINIRMIDVETATIISTYYNLKSSDSNYNNQAFNIYKQLTNEYMKYDRSIFPNITVYVTGTQDKAIKKHLNSIFIKAFTLEKYLNVIVRSNSILQGINKELNYQYSGAVNDTEIATIGKQAGSHLICVIDCNGSYISARILNTETGEILSSNTIDDNKRIHDIGTTTTFAHNLISTNKIGIKLLNIVSELSYDINYKSRILERNAGAYINEAIQEFWHESDLLKNYIGLEYGDISYLMRNIKFRKKLEESYIAIPIPNSNGGCYFIKSNWTARNKNNIMLGFQMSGGYSLYITKNGEIKNLKSQLASLYIRNPNHKYLRYYHHIEFLRFLAFFSNYTFKKGIKDNSQPCAYVFWQPGYSDIDFFVELNLDKINKDKWIIIGDPLFHFYY